MWYFIKLFCATIFISTCTALYLLGATTSGLQYDINWLATKLPGKLSIKEVEGTLLSGFTLHNVSYESPEQQITFKLLNINWNPLLLLKGKVEINQLSIKDGAIILSDKKDDSNPSKMNVISLLKRIILHRLVVENLYLKQSASIIELNGELTDHWNLKWKLHEINLKNWLPNVDGNLNSEGTMQGDLTEPTLRTLFNAKNLSLYGQSISKLTGDANLSLKKSNYISSINLTLYEATLQNNTYKKLSFNLTSHIRQKNKFLSALINIQLDKLAFLTATLSFPDYSGISNTEQKIEGHVDLKPLNINSLVPSYAYIKNPQGKILGNLDISGLALHPILSAEVTLLNASFTIPSLGIKPEGINIKAHLTPNKIINLEGQFQSGSGKARVEGQVHLDQNNYPITLSVQGTQLSAVKLSEYKILASPDLNIQFNYPTLKVQGKILIPFAEIKPKNLSGTTTLPEEVVIVQEKKIVNSSPLQLVLGIDLKLGEKINVVYNSLQASLGGDIYITKEFDTPATAQGEFYALQGRYMAYGQKLLIDNGRLIYTGNTLTNPGLDIEATKKVRRVVTNNSDEYTTRIPLYAGTETLKVGIRVRGTAEKPAITLFSTPSDVSQADILSYIVLGQPHSNTTSGQGAAILSVLTNLNPNGNKINHYTEKLQEILGLSELNIESVQSFNPDSKSVESTTSFVIGKQLTKKLSLHYSIGLFDPISVLNLRYQIDNHWALQSETSTVDNGADLLYVFERD